MKVTIITVSDSRSTLTDVTGPLYAKLLSDDRTFSISELLIVKDNVREIKRLLMECVSTSDCDVIMTNGGTGPTSRDVTPEAILPLLEKRFQAMEQLLAHTSFEYTQLASLSRFLVGSILDKSIVCLPGSAKGPVQLNSVLKQVLPHLVQMLRDQLHDHKPTTSKQLEQVNVCERPRKSPYPIISIEEATNIIFEKCDQLINDSAYVQVEALHRLKMTDKVLAFDLRPKDIPPFRASIKDGYAVLSDDESKIRRVVSVHCAGDQRLSQLNPGECVRVSTGAVIPDAADAVIQVEDTKLVSRTMDEETDIEVLVMPKKGQDIREKGSDLSSETVFARGTICTPSLINLLAAGGLFSWKRLQSFRTDSERESVLAQQPGFLPVFREPRVAIFSTGNEIGDCDYPETIIVDTNRIVLKQLLTGLVNMEHVIDFGIARDSTDSLISFFQRALDRDCDVIVTSGGVSMGEKDLIIPTLTQQFGAQLHFARVWLKPGKPTTFFTLARKGKPPVLIFSLPGNPVSVLVTCQLFVLPAIRRILRYPITQLYPRQIKVKLEHEIKMDPRPEFRRAIIKFTDSIPSANCNVFSNQLSSCLASCRDANLLLKLPESEQCSSLPAGSIVDAFFISL
ncbi:hypothetical protein Ciccas_007735 [Cichlidogyrus casuarinus]|uniref:MoaB/Mog domain-containing protein n=1 Tax=Cichlidogyrus casuarinus TaxID=1844966 RepID=A0ABD2Q2R7_9PLAT